MNSDYDVLVVGGGVAGLTAATFTARAGLETLVARKGESLLRRNAHLENVPGFPAGVNARTFLDLLCDQAERAGVELHEAAVTALTRDGESDAEEEGDEERFTATLDADGEGERTDVRTRYVVAASKNETDYLADLEIELVQRGSKDYVAADRRGRTDVDGVYAAGRLAETSHQTVVAAGHGAEVALALVDDSHVPHYHDWVAPKGYFTERGRDVPPGCVEIDEPERRRRERESMAVMRAYFSEPHPDEPTMHPSVVEKRDREPKS